jgi:hypothetical protein
MLGEGRHVGESRHLRRFQALWAGCKVWGLCLKVQGFGFKVEGSGFRASGSGSGCRVSGVGSFSTRRTVSHLEFRASGSVSVAGSPHLILGSQFRF